MRIRPPAGLGLGLSLAIKAFALHRVFSVFDDLCQEGERRNDRTLTALGTLHYAL